MKRVLIVILIMLLMVPLCFFLVSAEVEEISFNASDGKCFSNSLGGFCPNITPYRQSNYEGLNVTDMNGNVLFISDRSYRWDFPNYSPHTPSYYQTYINAQYTINPDSEYVKIMFSLATDMWRPEFVIYVQNSTVGPQVFPFLISTEDGFIDVYGVNQTRKIMYAYFKTEDVISLGTSQFLTIEIKLTTVTTPLSVVINADVLKVDQYIYSQEIITDLNTIIQNQNENTQVLVNKMEDLIDVYESAYFADFTNPSIADDISNIEMLNENIEGFNTDQLAEFNIAMQTVVDDYFQNLNPLHFATWKLMLEKIFDSINLDPVFGLWLLLCLMFSVSGFILNRSDKSETNTEYVSVKKE